MPGSARDEAERLVATVLAMAGTPGSRDGVTAGLGALGDLVSRVAGAAINAAGKAVGQTTENGEAERGSAGGGRAGGDWAGGGSAGGRSAGRGDAGAARHGSG